MVVFSRAPLLKVVSFFILFSLTQKLRWQLSQLSRVLSLFCSLINPLSTNDAFWCRQLLAACYKLAQSVLKIDSTLAERVGQREVARVGAPLWLTVHGGHYSCL